MDRSHFVSPAKKRLIPLFVTKRFQSQPPLLLPLPPFLETAACSFPGYFPPPPSPASCNAPNGVIVRVVLDLITTAVVSAGIIVVSIGGSSIGCSSSGYTAHARGLDPYEIVFLLGVDGVVIVTVVVVIVVDDDVIMRRCRGVLTHDLPLELFGIDGT